MADTQTRYSVTAEKRNGGVGVITIDHPKRLNALNLEIKRMIESCIDQLVDDEDVRVIVLTGADGVFVAGTDISEMVDMQPEDHGQQATGAVFQTLRNCPKPLIAAIERFALGGGLEVALACDIIVAAENAKFAQPEIKVGIMPGAGGTQVLLRTLGKYRVMRMILTGDMIAADQMYQWGLVSELVEPGQALSVATEMAERIAKMPPLALSAIKRVVQHGQNLPLTDALALERKEFEQLFDSADQEEGMRAFIEKRDPEFRGR